MRYRITQLKAPWPEGAAVGDTIELDALPDWAVGKCVPETGSRPEADPAIEALEADLADARIKHANAEQRADAAVAEAEQLRAKVAELEAAAAKPPKPTKG